MKQVFLSYRAEPLPRWREAFANADIHVAYNSGTVIAAMSNKQAIIWLHLRPEAANMEQQISSVRSMAPGCPIVILSNTPSEGEGLNAFSAGAAGYCNALAVPELLRQVALVVEQGGLWIGQDLIKRLFGAMSARIGKAPAANILAALSPREAQVAQAVARGSTNKEIAHALAITERTVKAHLSAVFTKLGVRDRLQLSLIVNGVEASALDRSKISA